MKRRNAMAQELRTNRLYRLKVVPSKKLYSRKRKDRDDVRNNY